MKPGEVRSELEKIQVQIKALENELNAARKGGQFDYHETAFELAEASEAVGRAVETLDKNFRRQH